MQVHSPKTRASFDAQNATKEEMSAKERSLNPGSLHQSTRKPTRSRHGRDAQSSDSDRPQVTFGGGTAPVTCKKKALLADEH